MPSTINGIGTAICPGRGAVNWGGEPECDALEGCASFTWVTFMRLGGGAGPRIHPTASPR